MWFRKRKNVEPPAGGAAAVAAVVADLVAPAYLGHNAGHFAPQASAPIAPVPPVVADPSIETVANVAAQPVADAEPGPDLSARSDDMPETRPAAPFPLPLRGQATANDARAERLIRQIRSEVEDLRQTLDEMATAQEDMVTIDLDAVVADPEAAAALPPAVLVRGLITAVERISVLTTEMASVSESVKRLETLNHELELEHSFNRGRLETLDEVIAALHGNLQDLRYERDNMRLVLNGNNNGLHAQIAATAHVIESPANA